LALPIDIQQNGKRSFDSPALVQGETVYLKMCRAVFFSVERILPIALMG
jgi:hypothetical protein